MIINLEKKIKDIESTRRYRDGERFSFNATLKEIENRIIKLETVNRLSHFHQNSIEKNPPETGFLPIPPQNTHLKQGKGKNNDKYNRQKEGSKTYYFRNPISNGNNFYFNQTVEKEEGRFEAFVFDKIAQFKPICRIEDIIEIESIYRAIDTIGVSREDARQWVLIKKGRAELNEENQWIIIEKAIVELKK